MICSTVCSGTDQRKHQSSASLAFVRGIHRWPVNSHHKGPVTQKMFSFDDVVMIIHMDSCIVWWNVFASKQFSPNLLMLVRKWIHTGLNNATLDKPFCGLYKMLIIVRCLPRLKILTCICHGLAEWCLYKINQFAGDTIKFVGKCLYFDSNVAEMCS